MPDLDRKNRKRSPAFFLLRFGLILLSLLSFGEAAASEAEGSFWNSLDPFEYRLTQDRSAGESRANSVSTEIAEGISSELIVPETLMLTLNAGNQDSPELHATMHSNDDIYGPLDVQTPSKTIDPDRYRSFGSQLGAVKLEVAAIAVYYTALNGKKLFDDPQWPRFNDEGWFGRSTENVGVDKLTHFYSTYILSELLYARLKRKTENSPGIQYTAAAAASGLMLYTELWDSIERGHGWSWQDVAFNGMGAGFSILRNSVPNLDQKLDYRLMIEPNSKVFSGSGRKHFEQQKFFFALKFGGFKAFETGPLRYLEFHLGYRGKDFTMPDRAAGIIPKRQIFAGFGINFGELLFKNPKSRAGRVAGEVLDYFQLPYTAAHIPLTN